MTEKKSSQNPIESLNAGSFFEPTVTTENTVASSIFPTLNENDQSRALLLASKLDVSSFENILHFGEDIQISLKNFTHNLLVRVQRNDTSPIREVLFQLMAQLEKIDPDDLIDHNKGFLRKLFRRSTSTIQEVISQYNRLSKQIDRLSIQLQHAQKGLLADMNMLNELFRLNEDYYNNINIYIAAGEMKKHDLLNNELPKLQTLSSGNTISNRQIMDLTNAIEWLDRRIYDLQISREIAIQTAPQILLIQQTNEMLIEKIQSSVLTTIPLWQSQISILVNINNQRRANLASRRLMDSSDEMIRKNAKMIEVTAKDTKRQKSITHADIDSFKHTQLQLIESIEETLRVQAQSNEQQTIIEKKIGAFEQN